MARIPRDVVDAIRDRTDIVEVIGRHVGLQQRSGRYVGLCPFHDEKTPSFHVIPAKAMYYCFGCHAGGDAFSFLMKVEGLSFVESVKELAGPAGIEVEERELTEQEKESLRQRATLYDVMEEAAKFFEARLWTGTDGHSARLYLEQRGIETTTSQNFRLGYAPDGFTHLVEHLNRKGIPIRLAFDAGLVRERQRSDGYFDTFRNRIVIPIRDDRGRIIAFGGRLLDGEGPKYLNSPETQLYKKSRTLYALHIARPTIQRNDRVIVVEGYFDVISMHQAGFQEAVATCGTALTTDHLERLRRHTQSVILLLDADEAGYRAAERTLPLCVQAGIDAWRLEMPDAKDPDELIQQEGTAGMEHALTTREPLFEWCIQRKLRAHGSHTMGHARVLEEFAPLLARMPRVAISRTAALLRTREEIVAASVHRARQRQGTPTIEKHDVFDEESSWRPNQDIVHLLWLLVHQFDHVAELVGRVQPEMFDGHAPVRGVVARLIQGEPVASVQTSLDDGIVRRTLSAVVAREQLYQAHEAAKGVCEILERLRLPSHAARLAQLSEYAEKAQQDEDWDRFRSLANERALLLKQKKERHRALSSGDIDRYIQLSGP